MASKVVMQHQSSGVLKDGYFGFSWTTLFFGFFPALFRGDYLTFVGGSVVAVIIGIMTFGIGWLLIGLVWAFLYNRYYTRRLLEAGYRFSDSPGVNAQAAAAVGVSAPLATPTAGA